MTKSLGVRCAAVIAGVLLIGVAVALLRMAALGVDPYSSVNNGLSAMLGLSFGSVQLADNVLLLVFVFLMCRRYIGFGTVFNMIFVGYTADFVKWAMERSGVAFTAWPARILVMAAAIILICYGMALYMSADLGLSPYDAFGYVLVHLTGGRLPFRFIRIFADAVCVCIGFAAASRAGVQWDLINAGTIVLTFGTGPLAQFFREHSTDGLLRPYRGDDHTASGGAGDRTPFGGRNGVAGGAGMAHVGRGH